MNLQERWDAISSLERRIQDMRVIIEARRAHYFFLWTKGYNDERRYWGCLGGFFVLVLPKQYKESTRVDWINKKMDADSMVINARRAIRQLEGEIATLRAMA